MIVPLPPDPPLPVSPLREELSPFEAVVPDEDRPEAPDTELDEEPEPPPSTFETPWEVRTGRNELERSLEEMLSSGLRTSLVRLEYSMFTPSREAIRTSGFQSRNFGGLEKPARTGGFTPAGLTARAASGLEAVS